MEIRQLSTTDEIEDCRKIQRKAWNFGADDVLPFHLIRAFCDAEAPYGLILGAFDKGIMTGFCMGLPTLKPGVILLHLLAVLPEYHRSGIGSLLMNALIAKSGECGFNKIVWTYDPLESVNASLYFHKMKAVCRKYVKDYYFFNKSNLSEVSADRFKMELDVNTTDNHTYDHKTDMRVQIPGNFQEIKESSISSAIELRTRTREVFERLINQEGYVVVDFIYDRSGNTGEYVLLKNTLTV